MDIYIAAAVALLLVWVGLVTTTDASGWVHLLLTGGMFLLVWRIVVRGTPSGPASAADDAPTASTPASVSRNSKEITKRK